MDQSYKVNKKIFWAFLKLNAGLNSKEHIDEHL